MNKHFISILFAALLACIVPAYAQAMLPASILLQIEALQRRADLLAYGEIGPDNYHLAKARTWLDMALSEYHENEQNGIVPDILKEIEPLIIALENRQADIGMDTPRKMTGSLAVRPDLWDRIDAMKSSASFTCGQRPLAEAEVHLVWAGHEKHESSWAHASTYAHSAEELLHEAEGLINACELKTNPPITEKLTLSSDAIFGFGNAKLEPAAQWRLNRLADHIKQEGTNFQEVILVGHTDRLRSDGRQERNQILSEQRAERIKKYLVGKGISPEKIKTSGAGSSQPLVECSTRQSKNKQIDCLQPNRRVEIILRGVR